MTENSSPRKFLSLKHLVNNKTTSVNWTEKLALKYKTIVESHKMIVKKTEEIMKNNQQQKIFMKKLQELSRRWEIVQQGNSLFAVIGKNTQGDIYKALLLKDPENGIKVDLTPEMKKLKILKVSINCSEITLPELKITNSIQFLELEKAERLIIDSEIMKELQHSITNDEKYSVIHYTRNKIEISVNVRVI